MSANLNSTIESIINAAPFGATMCDIQNSSDVWAAACGLACYPIDAIYSSVRELLRRGAITASATRRSGRVVYTRSAAPTGVLVDVTEVRVGHRIVPANFCGDVAALPLVVNVETSKSGHYAYDLADGQTYAAGRAGTQVAIAA